MAQDSAASTSNNPPSVPKDNEYANEIDLRLLVASLWRGKWIIIATTSLFACVGALVALSMPNQYQSTVVLAEVEQDGSSKGLLAQYGGLAAMAGINLGSGGSDKVAQALMLLKSWPFLEEWVAKNSNTAEIAAVKKWDRVNNVLVYDENIYNPKTHKWLADPDTGESLQPKSFEVYKILSKMLDVSQDKKTGLVTVSMEYYSPELAQQWLNDLVVSVNEYYRKKDIVRTKKNIEFLEKKLEETSIAEFQRSLYSMIETQLKTLMLAEVSQEYLLETVVPSKVAEEKSRPRRSVIVLLCVMLGGGISVVGVLIKWLIKQSI